MLEWLYAICVLILAAYGLNSFVLTLIYWFHPRTEKPTADLPRTFASLPSVTVQLPVYNERYVVERLLSAVSSLEYPHDRFLIQVLDDSDDDTSVMVDKIAARLRARGVRIEVCRRGEPHGFKAGALKDASDSVQADFIAIFDADFLPPRDFLVRLLPYFADPSIGCVQARWGHVNGNYSLLTQLQSAGIDGHFIVEQEARNRMGWFIGFNGSAGIWRRACIEDAGGWQADTLTEDLDLSYRAQLKGWTFRFVADLVVPAEVPVQFDAYRRQQFRWAKGSVQTLKKTLPVLLRARLPFAVKLQAVFHLAGYLIHVLIVLVFLLAIPMALMHSALLGIVPYLTISMLGAMALYGTSVWRHSRSVLTLVSTLGMLVLLGTGMSLNNTRAAVEALLGVRSGFRRTPKFDVRTAEDDWHGKQYTLPGDPMVWIEGATALVAFLIFMLGQIEPWWRVNQWILIYALGYGFVAGLSVYQSTVRQHARRSRALVARPDMHDVSLAD